MSFDLSKITIVGRLGADSEQREVNGKLVVNFNVAASYKRGQKEVTTWFSCSIWEKFAEVMGPKLTKGSKVCVHGDFYLDEYPKKDTGEIMRRATVNVDNLILMEPRRNGTEDPMEFPPKETGAQGSPFRR